VRLVSSSRYLRRQYLNALQNASVCGLNILARSWQWKLFQAVSFLFPVIDKLIHFSMIPLQVKLPKPPEQEESHGRESA
jgi:hypothetical protein